MHIDRLIRRSAICIMALCGSCIAQSQQVELLKYGNFDNWIEREIKESSVIGGGRKTLYEIAPAATITGNRPYTNMGGSPWATSNVYAHVAGIDKASNAVFAVNRPGHGKCARLCTMIESVKVLHIVNMDVLVAGSIFLGEMIEPVTDTKNPMRKMDMGVGFTGRPTHLTFDYMLELPSRRERIKSSGFGKKKTIEGRDSAVVFLFLQSRAEDKDGNIRATRIATAGVMLGNATGWIDGYNLPLIYGDCSARHGMEWLELRNGEQQYYARNSKGNLVPVTEHWGDGTETPTHLILMISAANGKPYVGTPGMTLYIDNVGFRY